MNPKTLPFVFSVFLLLLSQVFGLSRPPHLECLEDAMRLHFVPEGYPFMGHVYVKGFFYSSRCHLDYTQYSMAAPFFFHIPYKSDCQIKRERLQNPHGISYSVIVVVQHHRLFVTAQDKAYSVSCFYRDANAKLEQSLEIGDLTTQIITESDGTPTCSYEVLRGSTQGPAARSASIGDVLVHKFSCDSSEMGILVHSCFVRDGIGNEVALVNDRGCSTDTALVVPLVYTDDLTSASTPIAAFKFADQMIVYFTCQVTLCNKADNGCEGITPPNCEYLPLPNEDNGYSVPVTSRPTNESGYPYVTETMAPRPSTTPTPPPTTTSNGAGAYGPATRPPIPPVVTLSSEDNYNGAHMPAFIPQEDLETNVDAESGFVAGGFASAGGYVSNPYGNSNTIITGSTTAPIRPQPLGPENIFRRGFAASRHARNSNLTDKLTIGVSAEQLIVFAKDEKEPKEVRQKQAEEILAQSEAVCRQDNFSALIWIAVLVATLLGSTILLFLQNRYYRQKIQKSIKGFGPTPEVISVAFGSQF